MNTLLARNGRKAALVFSMLTALAASNPAAAGGQDDQISFDLVPNPQFVDCMRANYDEEPRAHATIFRGKLNETLVLELEGFKPGLKFDLFSVQNSPFFADATNDPAFKGFGLAWYQSDVEVHKHHDGGRAIIKTVLLDQTFGFDPDVGLAPTNTFHLGFWFDNPDDAQPCSPTPIRPTPFNGEHNAGPFAMVSATDPTTRLGPLCTNPDVSTTPVRCDP